MFARELVPCLALAASLLAQYAKSGAAKATDAATADAAAFYATLDCAKIDRTLKAQPTWVAGPRWAFFVLGPTDKAVVACALDKSSKDGKHWDVLYFDRDGDRDLTDADERFTGKYNEAGAAAGLALAIKVGDYAVPGTPLVHKNLRFSTVPKTGEGIWFSMDWNGKVFVCGGFDRMGQNCTQWGTEAKTAPVLVPTVTGPFAFAFFSPGGDVEIMRGHEEHVSLMVGHPGSGPDTLCPVSEELLDLGRERIVATVIGKDANGKELQVASPIQEHC
jgi:hypothetical protein